MTRLLFTLLLLAGACQCLPAQSIPSSTPDGGGEYTPDQPQHCLPPTARTQIQHKLLVNRVRLQDEGKLRPAPEKQAVSFAWPLMQKAAGLAYNDFYGISGYVDQDPSSGVENYNCTDRTYDGHRGTDYFLWPFPWYLYENDMVEVVAGAPGTIIGKDDNQDDDHCMWIGNWNAVYIEHSDGSVAWYGHLKKNTLTTKAVGQTVVAGEYLGVVASSGMSTAPHLHFEVYDDNNNLIDPYQGTCNALNSSSWWASQRPYREPRLNALLTHSDEPLHGCPTPNEVPYFSNDFAPGAKVYLAAYYADQTMGDVSTWRVLKPDNSVYDSWTHTSSDTYNASYWFWTRNLPMAGPFGAWKLEVDFKGTTTTHVFNYGNSTSIEQNELARKVTLLPNPMRDQFEISGIPVRNAYLEITDPTGRTVRSMYTDHPTVDISSLPSGIYLVTLSVPEGQVTKRILKQ